MVVFGSGLLAGPLSLILFALIERFAFYRSLGEVDLVPDLHKLLYAVFGIGFIEEVSKLLVCVWLLRRRELSTRRPIDGVLYAAAVSFGFATIENWYAMLAEGSPVWSRAVTLPFTHVLFSGLWGVALGLDLARRRLRGIVSLGLVLAIVYHGLYDYIILAESVSDLWLGPLIALLWAWLAMAAQAAAKAPPRTITQEFRAVGVG